jgi:hypothetical protein
MIATKAEATIVMSEVTAVELLKRKMMPINTEMAISHLPAKAGGLSVMTFP